MDATKTIADLKQKYPGKNIVVNPDAKKPTEIVCEIDPANGIAVAVIDRSEPHHHNHTVEEYKVLDGQLTMYINGNEKVLETGDTFEIYPGEVHFAVGDETWIEAKSTPPWSPADHIMEDNEENHYA